MCIGRRRRTGLHREALPLIIPVEQGLDGVFRLAGRIILDVVRKEAAVIPCLRADAAIRLIDVEVGRRELAEAVLPDEECGLFVLLRDVRHARITIEVKRYAELRRQIVEGIPCARLLLTKGRTQGRELGPAKIEDILLPVAGSHTVDVEGVFDAHQDTATLLQPGFRQGMQHRVDVALKQTEDLPRQHRDHDIVVGAVVETAGYLMYARLEEGNEGCRRLLIAEHQNRRVALAARGYVLEIKPFDGIGDVS